MKNTRLDQARIGLPLVERMIAEEYNKDRLNINSPFMDTLFDKQSAYMDTIKELG